MESYVTPILLSYVDKYVRGFSAADVQVSLWSGGVTLHNLVLRPDVLQRELGIPFTLVSGRIHELSITVPWTKIGIEPIEVKINTIECVLSLSPPNVPDENVEEQPRNQLVPSPPRYMRGLIRRVVSNISVTIQSLIVKYVQDDIVLSLNIKWLYIDSADDDWKPAFVDIDAAKPVVRRLVRLDDFTLCVDRSDGDGRIRHYQEPLLDRCQLEIRILTSLVSLKNRKAKNLTVQIRSENLEMGVTSDQLLLLLRLFRERPPPSFIQRSNLQPPQNPAPPAVSSSTEAPRVETWSEWAWSWLPSWSDRGGVGETPTTAEPFPILVSAFLDKVAFVFKATETEVSSGRRYARPLLELGAAHLAVSYLSKAPTIMRFRMAARALQLVSRGKCVCGHIDLHGLQDKTTPFMVTENPMESDFSWPEDILKSYTVEPVLEAEETGKVEAPDFELTDNEQDNEICDEDGCYNRRDDDATWTIKEEEERTWFNMTPSLYIDVEHDRTAPKDTCPYENIPQCFDYSDWKENQRVRICFRPATIYVCAGLLHRLEVIHELLQELPPVVEPELAPRSLTIEECEALTLNMAGRRLAVKIRRLEIKFLPWDHYHVENPIEPQIYVLAWIYGLSLEANGPLYHKRVCLAAREIPDIENPIHEAAYAQIAVNLMNIVVFLSTPKIRLKRSLLRGSFCLYGSYLLHKELFKEQTIFFHGELTIPLITIYVTPAGYQTALEVLQSLYYDRVSTLLRDTTLAEDAMDERDTTAIDSLCRKIRVDITVADNIKMIILRVFNTKMAGLELKDGKENNIGWILSAPDYEGNVIPGFMMKLHLCDNKTRPDALDYIAIKTDSSAFNFDPMLVRWLSYRPRMKRQTKSMTKTNSAKSMTTSKFFPRRRGTPPASAGRASRSGSATEFIHGRTRSAESISERRAPQQDQQPKTANEQTKTWENDKMVKLYKRMRHTLISVEAGPLLIYNTVSTASLQASTIMQEELERDATEVHRVLVFSLGKWAITTAAQGLWDYVNERTPTFIPPRLRLEQSFPWKLKMNGMSSFTLEACPPTEVTSTDRSLVRLQSQAQTAIKPTPHTVLEMLESTIIISIVTKPVEGHYMHQPRNKRPPPSKDDKKKKYFTAGMDYRPTNLREYVRGPGRRPGSPEARASTDPPDPPAPPPPPPPMHPREPRRSNEPFNSLGVHIHADTPPVTIQLTQGQVHIVRAVCHYLAHIHALLRRPYTPIPLAKSRSDRPSSAPLIRSGTEQRSSSEGTSDNASEKLIPIFQTKSAQESLNQIKVLIWFQWVVNRASISFLTDDTKVTAMIDDTTATIDLQDTYDQIRLKIAQDDSAQGWEPGVLGGKLLEMRETADGKPIQFLTSSITKARPSNLPTSWKEEFLLKQQRPTQKREGTWELSVKTAPLEVMIHPSILEVLTLIGKSLVLKSFCPVQLYKSMQPLPMPVCHLDLGGVRVLVSSGEYNDVQDDTLIFNIENITSRRHPQNPICRRSISSLGEPGWVPVTTGSEVRQHEIVVNNLSVCTGRIQEILAKMTAMLSRSERIVNPAANWAEPLPVVHITPIIHDMDVHGVFAPPLFSGTSLVCGPALELSMPADVTVELSAEQLALLARLLSAVRRACTQRSFSSVVTFDYPSLCPLSTLHVYDDLSDEEEEQLDESTYISDLVIDPQPSTSQVQPQTEPKHVAAPSGGQTLSSWNHMEIFMVMGRIDFAFYVRDNPDCAIIRSLRPPETEDKARESPENDEERANVTVVIDTGEENDAREPEPESAAGSKSLTETVRDVDVGRSRLEIFEEVQFARRYSKFIPVLHATLSQPNMYYWQKKAIKGLQMSLFNLWVAHGEGQDTNAWHLPLLSTREGERDPDTEIPPSLASLHFDTLPGQSAADSTQDNWSVKIDIDRPVSVDLYQESLRRLKIINALVSCALTGNSRLRALPRSAIPIFNLLHSCVESLGIVNVTLRTSQMAFQTVGVSAGWESLSAQAMCVYRPERLSLRVLLSALTITTEAPSEPLKQHVAVQPVTVGTLADVAWETWRTGERGKSCKPAVRVAVEMSDLAVDVRPCDVAVLQTAVQNITEFLDRDLHLNQGASSSSCSYRTSTFRGSMERLMAPAPDDTPASDVYYKDDLRSGAFKILGGDETRTPMAYEVALRGNTVMWHYPMPRSIVRIVAHPLPDMDEEVECILESFNLLLGQWETNAHFEIPVTDSREFRLTRVQSDKVFATMWRVRLMPSEEDSAAASFEFNREKYLPQNTPVIQFGVMELELEAAKAVGRTGAGACQLSVEQVAGALRVDSYLAARLTPRLHVAAKCGSLALHAHNNMPPDETLVQSSPNMTNWEGLYVSNGQRRSHRVLSVVARNASFNATQSPSHKMLSYEGQVGVDMFESETGTMEPLVRDFKLQVVLAQTIKIRARVCAGDIRVLINGPRVRTLESMVNDWMPVYEEVTKRTPQIEYAEPFWMKEPQVLPSTDNPEPDTFNVYRTRMEDACKALEGRVYLYVINTCDVTMRIGQEGTDELILLSSNTTLAYRWNSPVAPKRLRFSNVSVSSEWHWSNSVPFTDGVQKVRLDEAGEAARTVNRNNATYLFLRVEDLGGRKNMYLSGKVFLGNMLREQISFKVRVRDPKAETADGMRTVSRGELMPESVGNTVLEANCAVDTYIKIKFASQETGWTGDIPLKTCPKAHVPWLVKVPVIRSDVPCVSVWCRVERTRKDDRVTVLFFPMFLMRSHLPLDVTVSMTTELIDNDSEEELAIPLLTQQASGRGTFTQLLAHGTTTVKHTLIFKYRMADCQVTRESVPLHYGMVEKSVFEQYSPLSYTEDVAADALRWLTNEIGVNTWPYSVVRTHWPSPWQAAPLQPRCDVLVRHSPVVCGGGGCGLLVQLMPRAMLANAARVALTVRMADTSPLCRVDPGMVIALPGQIVENPFYITIQEKHETYLSNELSVCHSEPGVYGTLSPGQIALDRPTFFAVHCNDRVALMSIYNSLYEEMSVFGVTTTYVLMNKMPFDLLVSPIIIQYTPEKPPILRPEVYTRIQPTADEILFGERITYFWLGGPWGGSDVESLRPFLCFAIPTIGEGVEPSHPAVPVQVGGSAMRRSIALRDHMNQSVPVVVTQVQHEGRWVVMVAPDPCPQYLVRNMTKEPLALAQPLHAHHDHHTQEVQVHPECSASKWWLVLEPKQYSYYSTPTHLVTSSTAAPANEPGESQAALLTAGRMMGEFTPVWGNPFSVKSGEQLVQMTRDLNIKVRVTVYPHSTLVDLLTIDEDDLSASEIRRRLALQQSYPDYENPLFDELYDADDRMFEEPDALDLLQEDEREFNDMSPISNDEPTTETQTPEETSPDKLPESEEQTPKAPSTVTIAQMDLESETSLSQIDFELDLMGLPAQSDWLRCVASSVTVELAHGCTDAPLVRATGERVALLLETDGKSQHTMVSVGDVQVDNPQHASRQFDFAVIASTSAAPRVPERFPPLWGMLLTVDFFDVRPRASSVLVRTMHERWTVGGEGYGDYSEESELRELRDVDIYVGPTSLYIEDVFVRRVSALMRLLSPPAAVTPDQLAVAEALTLYTPLRVNRLYVHPLDITLTLHTAMRLYIGVDKSPLRMSAFKLENVVTTSDRLTHELTVHYLSGAILGVGWVVGGLELLGAPGSLAARLTSARGGVRDVATTAGAAVLRSLNSCAGSLARNLDLLAGDDEHTERAAVARREIPPTLMAGLFTGIQNFAVNILGAVGGLAHHPVVGLAVGETTGAAALRRGLVGALAKPLSATADLVAFAGQGLLSQTGWDPDPQQRPVPTATAPAPWRRDSVRWAFRLQPLRVLYGDDATLDGSTVRLVVTDKFLVVSEPSTERIVEMVDYRFCKLLSYDGHSVELCVTQLGPRSDTRESGGEEIPYRINSAAMARVAKYTGTRSVSEGRILRLYTAHSAPALAAAIAVSIRQNQPTHFSFL